MWRRDRCRLKKTSLGEGETGNRNRWRRDRYRLKKTDIGEGYKRNRWRRDRYRLDELIYIGSKGYYIG